MKEDRLLINGFVQQLLIKSLDESFIEQDLSLLSLTNKLPFVTDQSKSNMQGVNNLCYLRAKSTFQWIYLCQVVCRVLPTMINSSWHIPITPFVLGCKINIANLDNNHRVRKHSILVLYFISCPIIHIKSSSQNWTCVLIIINLAWKSMLQCN